MRIFVCVKTIPVLSETYGEVVCTAGINEDGDFIRIYPIPYRHLDYEKRFTKFQWISITDRNLLRRTRDQRPESHHIESMNSIIAEEKIGADHWTERHAILFKKEVLFTRFEELLQHGRDNTKTLAFYKPARILKMVYEPNRPNFQKLQHIRDRQATDLFKDDLVKPIKQPDFVFRFLFEDELGKTHKLMIEDWEVHALYRNCRKQGLSMQEAAEEVVNKYRTLTSDAYKWCFIMGTIYNNQLVYKTATPWAIIGLLYRKITDRESAALHMEDLFAGL